jgi:hypothetical protein
VTESEVKQLLLVRAVEEEDPALILPEVLAEAGHAAGDRGDLDAFCLRRAAYILDRLPDAPRRLLGLELPPPELSLAFWIAAAVLGLASNGLSLGHRIHALANPVTALVLWNLGVYGVIAVTHARTRKSGGSSPTAPLRPLLALLARAGVLWARLRGRRAGAQVVSTPGAATRVRVRFVSDYAALCAQPVLARGARLVHGAAIAFALGALAGIYLQGVAFAYRVEWGSTLVSSPAVRATLAAALFLPARILLGANFPDADQLALAATAEGAPAAIWFHVFALTVACVVLVPRAALALAAGLRARRRSRSVTLPVEDPYWRNLAERPAARADGGVEKAVLSYFALDADACTVLASLQAGLVADDIGATPAGRVLDTLGRKKAWYERWRLLVGRGFAAFPERERPRLVDPGAEELATTSARVLQAANPFAAELILLELAAFEAYWPLDPRDVALRDRLLLTPSLQRRVREAALARASTLLGLPAAEGEALRAALAGASRELSGLWSKVFVGAAAGTALGALTLGIAAPVAAAVVAKAVGAGGLLALKAGLAALGGHLVVGAGLGAASGTLVVMGGGALLGPGAAGVPGGAALTPASALLSSAKIEVFLRRIVAERHRQAATFAAILAELHASVARLREELPAFRLDPGHSTKQIQERERVIAILEQVAARNEAWGRRHESV